jgi:predicted transposase YdaD
MQTDLPLKRLTQLCPGDLLPLLGAPEAEVVAVESLELPASKSSLDTLLRLRQPDGTEYLHLVERQGYRDPQFLWRTLGYLSWLGQNRRERPILATVIYLHPGDDVGDTLEQGTPGMAYWIASIHSVRLWTLDAAKAVASDAPGLAVVSPLMDRVTPALVEQAADIVLRRVEPANQDELLTVLGIFAEGVITPENLERIISRERVMASTFIRHIFQEEFSALEAESQRREAMNLDRLRRGTEDIVAVRFPNTPIGIVRIVQQISDPDALLDLQRVLLRAADQAEAERILAQIGEQAAR